MILGSTLLNKRHSPFASPLGADSIQPASIDLTLADEYLIPVGPVGGVWRQGSPIEYTKHKGVFVLGPHKFVLARTVETVELSRSESGLIEGRSSIGRSGLFIHNAGWVDPGFFGTITLELYNANDYAIELVAGTRICQLVLIETVGCDQLYQGKYQGQVGPMGYKADSTTESLFADAEDSLGRRLTIGVPL
jgi:dCTP deaminase